MKSLYETTGRIEDINTVLVRRVEFEALAKAAQQALEAMHFYIPPGTAGK